MKVSARNLFTGKVSAVITGAVNTEVELTTDGGDKFVAVITEGSVKSLGLAVGKPATAIVKAPWVILVEANPKLRFSARNHFTGTVSDVTKGGVNTEIGVKLPGGSVIHAVVTNEAVLDLGLAVGSPVGALIKSSHVVLAVPA